MSQWKKLRIGFASIALTAFAACGSSPKKSEAPSPSQASQGETSQAETAPTDSISPNAESPEELQQVEEPKEAKPTPVASPPASLPKAAESIPAPAKPPVKAKTVSAKFMIAMKEGRRLWARRKYKKAIPNFEKALSEEVGHPEALYWLAKSYWSAKKKNETLGTLEQLAKSEHPMRPNYRVEARLDRDFKALRVDRRFRKAVGIERDASDPPTAFERLVGTGGEWEQEAITCDQPKVNLQLTRGGKRRFDLVIRSNCQGVKEVTRLDGQWKSEGDNLLHLLFPNQGADDEKLPCRLELCSDSPEDCLRCQPEPEIEFLLRVVRRR